MAGKDNPFGDMMNIWQESQEAFFKAQTEVAETFRKSMEEMSGQAKPEALNPSEALAAWTSFIKSWAPEWDPSSFMTQQGLDAKAWQQGSNAFFGLLEPNNWTQYAPEELRNILNMIAQGPRFADLATPQHDAATAWRESVDYSEAAADMSRVMQEAWTRAYQKYSEKHSLEDLQSGNVKGALDAWLAAANAELLETQKSPDFMDAQRRLLRASMEIKARQRDMAEAWSEAYQMPTRTEIDDLTKIVHELRREVRKLKRELAATKS